MYKCNLGGNANLTFLISLRSILSRDGVLYVKLRAGQLPYKDDPQGWKSLVATTVNHRSSGVKAFKVKLSHQPEKHNNIIGEVQHEQAFIVLGNVAKPKTPVGEKLYLQLPQTTVISTVITLHLGFIHDISNVSNFLLIIFSQQRITLKICCK